MWSKLGWNAYAPEPFLRAHPPRAAEEPTMRHLLAVILTILSLGAVTACAGPARTANSGVSRMPTATAERLAAEGAIANRSAGAGETGGDVGRVK
jgi:hypothetical protein